MSVDTYNSDVGQPAAGVPCVTRGKRGETVFQGGSVSTNAPEDGHLAFQILGPLEVRRGGSSVNLGSYKQRVLLATMLCRPNTVLRTDQLRDAIWDDSAPRTARKNLQVYVSALRKITGDRIRHHSYGYMLRIDDPQDLDFLRFGKLVAEARTASLDRGDAQTAVTLLHEALLLSRDRPLVDLLDNEYIALESARLGEQVLTAYEDWVDLEISLGRYRPALARLIEAADQYPLRERLTAATMTSLGMSGQRKAALARYESHRQLIARDLGLDPSPVLRAIYQQLLTTEPVAFAAVTLRDPHTESSAAKPAQLPRAPAYFVGRTTYVDELVTVLTGEAADVDVAVVSGATGVGKTALAVHVGHLVRDHFEDGHIFVSLRDAAGRARGWRDVLTELMRGAGQTSEPATDERIALAAWRSYIADRRYLFILDDATSESEVRRFLAGPSANRTIVTSSFRLDGLESVYRIDLNAFVPDETVALLFQTLGAARLENSDDAVDRINRRCGGLPIAVRAVAAKLSLHRQMSLESYADRLESLTYVFDELAFSGGSVRGRFDRFFTGLSPVQRAGLQALGASTSARWDHTQVVDLLRRLDDPAEQVIEQLMEANILAVAGEEVSAHATTYEMPFLTHRFAQRLAADK